MPLRAFCSWTISRLQQSASILPLCLKLARDRQELAMHCLTCRALGMMWSLQIVKQTWARLGGFSAREPLLTEVHHLQGSTTLNWKGKRWGNSREEFYTPPPPPPFSGLKAFFREGGGGVYFEALRGRNFVPPPLFLHPPPLEGRFQG